MRGTGMSYKANTENEEGNSPDIREDDSALIDNQPEEPSEGI